MKIDAVDGDAVVYCEGAFNTPNGKTAHGLVRFTRRYRVRCVIDSTWAGQDAGRVLDGTSSGIPVVASLNEALAAAGAGESRLTHFVVGLAPDGGRLPEAARSDIRAAIEAGLNVDCGLHDFLTEDPTISALALKHEVQLRDIRKPPPRNQLHFFSGKIQDVDCLKVALLGTDSAVGKRTTAWKLVLGLQAEGVGAELIGTGQTAWLQGAPYSLVMDSLINDFVAGEIEHAAYTAFMEKHPDVIVYEGQGSLLNPAYPGGFELLAAGRPDIVVLQHAPTRKEYDGFPGFPIQPLEHQIRAIEVISGRPVVAITVNHEDLSAAQIGPACKAIEEEVGLPAVDVLTMGPGRLLEVIRSHVTQRKAGHEPSRR
jgi:uncharacterized NAD-dependent epimerase/dehydratase family protein